MKESARRRNCWLIVRIETILLTISFYISCKYNPDDIINNMKLLFLEKKNAPNCCTIYCFKFENFNFNTITKTQLTYLNYLK